MVWHPPAGARTAVANPRRMATTHPVLLQIDVTAPWTEAREPIEALLDRRINGKAVLTLG